MQEEKKRSSETEDHEKQHLATLKILKRGDENELERKLRLENDAATERLRLAMETEGKKEEKKRYGLNLYLDIEFFNKKIQWMSSLAL